MTRSIAIVASALILGACATTSTVVDTSCTAFQPITYSAADDSEATKVQIRAHNAVWQELCK